MFRWRCPGARDVSGILSTKMSFSVETLNTQTLQENCKTAEKYSLSSVGGIFGNNKMCLHVPVETIGTALTF